MSPSAPYALVANKRMRPILYILYTGSAVVAAPFVSSASDVNASAAANSTLEQGFDAQRYSDSNGESRAWELTLGAGALFMPEYEGSDKLEVRPLPIVSAKVGDRINVDITGLSVDVIQHGNLRLGVKGGYEIGRKESDSRYLKGLGDIDNGGAVGGFVTYDAGPIQAYGKIDKTLGGSNGLVGTVGVKASYQYEKFMFSAEASGLWADENHMQAYFGVTKAQSAQSGLNSYDAKAGFKRVDLKASATYAVNENWAITSVAGVGILTGDAKSSPVVKKDVQPFGMIGVAYQV